MQQRQPDSPNPSRFDAQYAVQGVPCFRTVKCHVAPAYNIPSMELVRVLAAADRRSGVRAEPGSVRNARHHGAESPKLHGVGQAHALSRDGRPQRLAVSQQYFWVDRHDPNANPNGGSTGDWKQMQRHKP